jgi:hypothetical protein
VLSAVKELIFGVTRSFEEKKIRFSQTTSTFGRKIREGPTPPS